MRVRDVLLDHVLYFKMMSTIKNVLENEDIVKVFHDCRSDIIGIHKNGICPRNLRDTSVSYSVLA